MHRSTWRYRRSEAAHADWYTMTKAQSTFIGKPAFDRAANEWRNNYEIYLEQASILY